MFLLIYGLLGIFFDVGSDLIVEKCLCWVLELLSMSAFNKNCLGIIVDNDMWNYCISYASWLCEEKQTLLKGCMKWKKQKKKENDDKK